jgi:hypothetical protein
MGEIGTRLGQDISHTTFRAKTGRGDGMAEVFQMLDVTQKAIAALENKVEALEARLPKESES